jgi:thiamine biosynthesis lipoprotein
MKHAKSLFFSILVALLAAGSIILLVFLVNGGSGEGSGGYHSPTYFAMDTTLDITIQGRDEKLARQDVKAALQLVRKIESYTSRFKEGSDILLINEKAGSGQVRVHPETLAIIERSLELSQLSGGAFDVSVAPVVKLWGFYDQKYRVPSQQEIDNARALVDYRQIAVNGADGTVTLSRPGMEMDLGGVAKGYATGAVCDLLRDRGVKSGLVNFGGAVGAIGLRSDGKPWVVGIKSPRGNPEDLLGELKVSNEYVSSSGDYERFFIEDGKRYCHIFDPATGRQPTGVMSVTVVGPDSANADVLSTALFVLGPQKGLELLSKFGGYEAVFVDGSGKVESSKGMSRYVIEMRPHV